MNDIVIGQQPKAATNIDRNSRKKFFSPSAKEVGYQVNPKEENLTTEQKGFIATCEESYQMATQILAFQMMNVDACYTL